jgi:excisionase family DNA binding protein
MSETPPGDRDSHEWLTVDEVSRELSVHPVTVRGWLNRGVLSGSRAGRRKWVVRRAVLEEFMERGGSRETDEDAPPADRYAPPTDIAASVIDTLSAREGSS